MKICFVVGSLSYSGAEKVLSIIMHELANRGQDVSVILLQQAFGNNGKTGQINTFGAKSQGSRQRRLINRWKYIRRIVLQIRPDIVVSFGSVCNVNTIMSLWGVKTPLVICERNDPNFDPRTKKERIERDFLYRFADGFVFQTPNIANYFRKIIKNKPIGIIANPIIDSDIRWDDNVREQRIVTVARLDDSQKSHYLMMEAFEAFLKQHPGYILEIYGDGPDKNAYQNYIGEKGLSGKVVLKGKTDNPLKAMEKATAFILTSKFEGMPNSLMEAMSIGIPCVVTDCGGGGARALFEMCGIADMIVGSPTPQQIALALSCVADSEEIRLRLSSNELEINKLLRKENVVDQWQKYLLKIGCFQKN